MSANLYSSSCCYAKIGLKIPKSQIYFCSKCKKKCSLSPDFDYYKTYYQPLKYNMPIYYTTTTNSSGTSSNDFTITTNSSGTSSNDFIYYYNVNYY